MQEKKISTFAFLDIEATGIPSYDYNPKATDLCIIAIERQHLVSNNSHHEPKITNKIRLHINPKKPTPNFSLQLSGLSNADSNPEMINEDFVQLLLLFLKRLPHPVCLVAHNGNGFDFRLLQAEIKSIGCSFPDDILCADTYFAFQSILRDKLSKANITKGLSEINSLVNASDGCTVATSSTLGKSTVLNRLVSHSSSNGGGDNDNSDDSSSSAMEQARRNIIMNSKSVCHHVDEDEVEVIAIEDQRNDSPLDVSNVKQNGDKEVSCYPVIDLTEDSSMDASSDEESDDSNIIIENDDPTENKEKKKKREKSEPEKVKSAELVERRDQEMENIAKTPEDADEKDENEKVEEKADKNEKFEKNDEKLEKSDEKSEEIGKNGENSKEIRKNDETSEEIGNTVDKTEKIDEKLTPDIEKSPKEAEGTKEISVKPEKIIKTNGVGTDDSTSTSNKRPRDQDHEISNFTNDIKKSKIENETILNEESSAKTCNSDITHSSVIKTKTRLVQETTNRLAKLKFAHNFSLSALHQALTGRALGKDCTDAERDAAALVRVCQAAGSLFCEWTDTNAVSINTIQSFW